MKTKSIFNVRAEVRQYAKLPSQANRSALLLALMPYIRWRSAREDRRDPLANMGSVWLGAMKAIDHFQSRRSGKKSNFMALLNVCIIGTVQGSWAKRPVEVRVEDDHLAALAVCRERPPGDALESAEFVAWLLACLGDQERAVVQAEYLDDLSSAEVQQAAGGVTRARVCQVRTKALAKLRRRAAHARIE